MRPDTQSPAARRFQILSLDGGGIKGVFSAAFLAALEDDFQSKILDKFDLIAGTSTGGIIAIALGLGFTPKEILSFYLDHRKNIFPSGIGRSAQHWVYRKYSPEPLESALKGYFKDRLFGDSLTRLVVPAYSLGEDDVYVFRTPHLQHLKRDFKVPAWKVAMATTAAPTYFPGFSGVDSIRLIDGGVWANNPTMAALVEAVSLGADLKDIRILNIGTTDEITQRHDRLNVGGKIQWARANSAIDVILRGQSLAAVNHSSLLIGKENVIRISPTVPKDIYSLDGAENVAGLVGKASHFSRTFAPTYETKFLDHQPLPYAPHYRVPA